MRSYRLLRLDQRGRLVASKWIMSPDDQEAISEARLEMRRNEYVELWNGGRPIYMAALPPSWCTNLQAFLQRWRPHWT